MNRLENVAIVGVGLIGGSIGLALRQRGLAEKVTGIGRRQVSLRIARRVGAVTNTSIDLAKGVAGADLVVVCTPVGRIVEDVRRAAEYCPKGTLITDTGSTKRTIVEALDTGLPRKCRFLGGHPLAGGERGGPVNAQPELFNGHVAVITPTMNTRAEDFDLLEEFWMSLGSMVVQMPAAEHDRALAMTSHLPHVAATALAAIIPEQLFRLTGTGFWDTTRLACGDPSLWMQILELNRDHVLSALEEYGGTLAALHAAIRDGNQAELERILTTAKKNRDALGS
ncbi:MAG: prephenate dehydrogenase [Pirellulales bacterium]|nr:prephenate dehydrogenase [Pirellulales bacterium]